MEITLQNLPLAKPPVESNSPGTRGLDLVKGQLVNARVTVVKPDGLMLLNINGQLVEGYSQIDLPLNQEVSLQVQGRYEGKLHFKLLQPAVEAINLRDLAGLLKSVGVPSSDQSLAIAAKLLEFQLPVTAANVVEVQRLLGLLGETGRDNLNLAVFLLSAGLNQHREAIGILKGFFNNSNLGQHLVFLLQLLEKAISPREGGLSSSETRLNEVSNQSGNQPAGTVQESSVPHLESNPPAVSHLNPTQSQSRTSSPNLSFNQVLNNSNLLDLVQKEAGPVLRSEAGLLVNQETQMGNLTGKTVVLDQLVRELRLLLAEIIPPGIADRPEALTRYLQGWPANSRAMADLLKLIMYELQYSEPSQKRLGTLAQIINQSTETVVNGLYGQQLLHTVDKSTLQQPDYYYFSWLMPPLGKEAQGELRVYKRDRSRRQLNLEELRVVFSLETPHLGRNLFDIQFRRSQELYFRVQVEKEGVHRLVEEYWPELSERLGRLGYRSILQECVVGKPEPLCPRPEPKTSLEQVKRVDIKV
ncbi:MAG: hypothetical protein ACOX5W_03730 [Bacillota bacterium]|jgi:hypothetical protein